MMKLLRQFEPIKSFEYNLTPLERIEVKRKKREKNANTIENRLKKLEKRNEHAKLQKINGNVENNIKSSRKVKYY